MKFFDPACGCGNFLIIAYRELRELEIDLIRELRRGSEPGSAPFFRPFPGAREFIRGECRWILHTADIPPQHLRDLPMLRVRLQAVRDFRAKSKRKTTKRLADYPTTYGVTVVPETPFLIIPQVRGPSSNGTKTWCFRVVPEGN